MTDTNSDEYRMLCLARWVVKDHDDYWISDFLSRWKKEHGQSSHDKVREYIVVEWKKKRERR